MEKFTFSYAISMKENTPVRTVRVHIAQTSKLINGLCNYRVNVWTNEQAESRVIERSFHNVRYLETSLDAMAWVIGCYPEINTVEQPEPVSPDPIVEIRKEIERTEVTWRAVFADQVRVNDIVMWLGLERTVKEIHTKKRSAVMEFVFEDEHKYTIHKSVQLMIVSKENETR